MVTALQVSSDVYFYTLGAEDVGHRRPAAAGRTSSGSAAPTGHRPARRAAEGLLPSQPGATSSIAEGKPTGPGRPATTSSSRSARATCRPTRCRWRSPTRRSPTAAPSSRPHVGMEVEDAAGRVLQEFDPRPRRAGRRSTPSYRAAILEGLHDAAQASGRHLLRRLRRLPGAGGGQDRHRAAPGHADQSWYVVPGALPEPAYRHRRDRSRKAASAPNPPRRPRCRSSKPISTSTATGSAGPNGGSPG